MNKTQLLNDLRFILSKYGNELEKELFPVTDNNTQKDLIKFRQFIDEILADKKNQLTEKDYSYKEYSKIVMNEIQKIESSLHFENSRNKDTNIADQTIKAVSKEIKQAIL